MFQVSSGQSQLRKQVASSEIATRVGIRVAFLTGVRSRLCAFVDAARGLYRAAILRCIAAKVTDCSAASANSWQYFGVTECVIIVAGQKTAAWLNNGHRNLTIAFIVLLQHYDNHLIFPAYWH